MRRDGRVHLPVALEVGSRFLMIHSRKPYVIRLPGGRYLSLGGRTLVMGILNVTPDSFADGGAYVDPGRALEAAQRFEADGADLIDIGGESTRPGAESLPVGEELARVLPVIKRVVAGVSVPISVDTYKAEVARRALDAGAVMINDVSALSYDSDLARVVAAAGVPVVLMHNRGRSSKMYREARYENVITEVRDELSAGIRRATDAGISRDQVVVDPGLGFAKQATHTLSVLANLPGLMELDRPILVGPSRKSFLNSALGDVLPGEREWGTAAAVTAAVLLGAHIVRVHGVCEMGQVVRVTDEIRASWDLGGSRWVTTS
jgi:dihydropteroate synthase